MWKPKPGKRPEFYMRAIAARTWACIVAIYGALGFLLFIRDNLASPTVQAQWKVLAILHKLGWRTLGETLFAVVFVAMCEGTYREYREQRLASISAELRLRDIDDAKPNIVLCGPYTEKVGINQNGLRVCVANVLRVKLENASPHPYPNSEAKNVTATVSFYDQSGNLLIADMDARWTASSQPDGPHTQSIVPLLGMDIPRGAKRDLDIAFAAMSPYKAPLPNVVALNNDNFRFTGWGKPDRVLQGERFVAEIRVMAAWVDTKFSVEFWVLPHGEIEFRPQ